MAKAKQGDVFSCAECGLIVTVDEACGCGTAEILCCNEPMGKGKLAAGKARKKVASLSSAAKLVKTIAAAPVKKTASQAKKTVTKAAASAKKAPAKKVASAAKKAPAKKTVPAAKK